MSVWLTQGRADSRQDWQSQCMGLGGTLLFQVSLTAALHDQLVHSKLSISFSATRVHNNSVSFTHVQASCRRDQQGIRCHTIVLVPRKTFESGPCRQREQSAFLGEKLMHFSLWIVFSWSRHSESGTLGHFADLSDWSKGDKIHCPVIIPKNEKITYTLLSGSIRGYIGPVVQKSKCYFYWVQAHTAWYTTGQ